MVDTTIKHRKAGCGLEWPWEGGEAMILSVNIDIIFVGGGGGGVRMTLQFAARLLNFISLPGCPPHQHC